jgi:hypothetical protein
MGLALGVTLVAAYYAPAASDTAAEPTARPLAASPINSGSQTQLSVLVIDGSEMEHGLKPRMEEENQQLLSAFARPAPPTLLAPARAPIVTANAPLTLAAPNQPPPVPFQVVGKFVDGSDARIFLVFDGKNLVVHPGDAIGPDYTVSAIGSDQFTIRYLPLDVTQTVALPAPQ